MCIRDRIYGTYLGGKDNEFAEHRLALLPDGSVLVTGATSSPDFPTTPAAFQRQLGGKSDAFLTKISPDGKKLTFSTCFGGSGTDFTLMPTVDAEGNIYMVGQTSSPDIPVTRDAFQPQYGGGGSDGLLVVLSADGSKLVYSTYLGGEGDEMIRSLALGRAGEVYVVGNTSSADFPVTTDAFQKKPGGKSDAFLVKFVRGQGTGVGSSPK
ncbi:MAG: SBBP repeat-containing protein, partial [Kiritimatiellae bacterium]|nr:SBBP repeat-containing protein [Kiritimatiellia bacterium]